jgi:hypothetical protein
MVHRTAAATTTAPTPRTDAKTMQRAHAMAVIVCAAFLGVMQDSPYLSIIIATTDVRRCYL